MFFRFTAYAAASRHVFSVAAGSPHGSAVAPHTGARHDRQRRACCVVTHDHCARHSGLSRGLLRNHKYRLLFAGCLSFEFV